VWLDVPFDELLARIPADGRRPLAADRAQLERLYAVRQGAYANARLRIDARGVRPDEVAERIIEALG
jgi:shikimate kinase